jgi:hypothetical protein
MDPQGVRAQTASTLSTDSGSSTDSDSTVKSGSTTDPGSETASDTAATDDLLDWLFPVTQLNQSLPAWLRIGGQYRSRLEGPTGIGFARTKDFYLLDRLRVHVAIQPNDWLRFYGEVQDARIFFNHRIPNAYPYEDSWTLWQAYAQVGSSKAGSVDVRSTSPVSTFTLRDTTCPCLGLQ